MFASIISGALISVVLFYLASLPLMVAAIGWGPLSAIIGGLAAAVGMAAVLPLSLCFAYVITVALPACWLGHLAHARPAGRQRRIRQWRLPRGVSHGMVSDRPPPDLDHGVRRRSSRSPPCSHWAPMPRASWRPVKRGLEPGFLRLRGMAVEQRESIDAAAAFIPPAGIAIGPAITLTINLWLAGKVAAMSGRLHRPWPDLRTTALPPMTLVALCVAIAFCFVGGLPAMFAKVPTGALLTAYGLTGLAVLHTLTLACAAA